MTGLFLVGLPTFKWGESEKVDQQHSTAMRQNGSSVPRGLAMAIRLTLGVIFLLSTNRGISLPALQAPHTVPVKH